jgi:hypothetical protein
MRRKQAMRNWLICLTGVALIIGASRTAVAQTETTREFAQYQCKLALPGAEFKWLDETRIPNVTAMLGDASGTVLLLLVNPVPPGVVVSKKGFDDGFFKPGAVTKLEGKDITFRGVPCYQAHARIEANGAIATIRAFTANGFFYQLQLIGSNLPVSQREKLGTVFDAFQFVGDPVLPTPQPASAIERSLKFSGYMGRVVSLCLIAIVILLVVRAVRRKKPVQS